MLPVGAKLSTTNGPARIGVRELELYLRSVQKKLDPLLELTLSDAAGHVVASSAPTPAPIVLPANWPNNAITEGLVLEPPRWDDRPRDRNRYRSRPCPLPSTPAILRRSSAV